MTLPNEVKERAEFEAWAIKNGFHTEQWPQTGNYELANTQVAWLAWQARATPQPAPAQGVSDAEDAARYRFLEEQCRTGTYRGIISREAIDAARSAQTNGGGNG